MSEIATSKASDSQSARLDVWAALMSRIASLAPQADAEQVHLLAEAYRKLV